MALKEDVALKGDQLVHVHEHEPALKLQAGDDSQNAKIITLAKDTSFARVHNDRKILYHDKLTEPKGLAKDMPVAVVPGMKPGTQGLLVLRDQSGNEHLTPFIAGLMRNGKGTRDDVVLSPAAARELGIGKTDRPERIAVIALSLEKSEQTLPANKDELNKSVKDRLFEIASNPEVLKKAESALEGSEVKDKAYFPKSPEDPRFGIRRTSRDANDLSYIKQNLQKEAQKNRDIAENLKPGSQKAAETVAAIRKSAEAEKARLQSEQKKMQELHSLLSKGKTLDDIDRNPRTHKLLSDLPPDLKLDVKKAIYNRDAADKNRQLADQVFPLDLFGNKQRYLDAAREADTYAKRQEYGARLLSDRYAKVLADKVVLQDRIIQDTENPKAQELLHYRYSMKAYAADVVAANPDLAVGRGSGGALQGKRIVFNAGHDPFHGSPYTGFGAYSWSKTAENPRGMSEYDFNKQSTAIAGEMTELMGGVPIYINQDELYERKPEAQKMPGLAAAMEAPKADVMISNHMDDFPGIKPGTLTLVNSNSRGLGALVSQAKGLLGDVPVKGVRAQARGIQHYLRGPSVLNELLTTSPGDREKAMNPHEVAKIQLGMMLAVSRHLTPPSKSRLQSEAAADSKGGSWDDFWKDKAPKSTPYSLSYPRIHGKN